MAYTKRSPMRSPMPTALRRSSQSEVQRCEQISSEELTLRRRSSDGAERITRSPRDSRPQGKGVSKRAMDFELALWTKHSKLMQSRLSAVQSSLASADGHHRNHSAHSLPNKSSRTLNESCTRSLPLERAKPATDEPQQQSPREFVRQVSRKLDQVLTRYRVDSCEVEQEHRRLRATPHAVPRSIRMTPKSVRGGGGSAKGVPVLISSLVFHGALCAVLMACVLFMGRQLAVVYTNIQL